MLLSWSSGKDSAWALHVLNQEGQVDVVGLLTTVSEDRVVMHEVGHTLVEAQARATGLPLITAKIPDPCSNEEYGAAMQDALATAERDLDIDAVAFGDLFLEDVRRYREEKMAATGLASIFPLWGRSTQTLELAQKMIRTGLQAYVVAVNLESLPVSYLGRAFDTQFIEDLPEGVDPCGEYGEFHTFVHDGPMFQAPITFAQGSVTKTNGFAYANPHAD